MLPPALEIRIQRWKKTLNGHDLTKNRKNISAGIKALPVMIILCAHHYIFQLHCLNDILRIPPLIVIPSENGIYSLAFVYSMFFYFLFVFFFRLHSPSAIRSVYKYFIIAMCAWHIYSYFPSDKRVLRTQWSSTSNNAIAFFPAWTFLHIKYCIFHKNALCNGIMPKMNVMMHITMRKHNSASRKKC